MQKSEADFTDFISNRLIRTEKEDLKYYYQYMKNIYHNRFFAMGTRFHTLLPGMDDDTAERVFYLMKDEVLRIEKKLSRFIPESDISRLNKSAKEKPVIVDDELFDILNACRFCWDLTDGAFDLTLRPLMDFWKNQPQSNAENDEFAQLKKNLGLQHVNVDDDKKSVQFSNNQIEIDLGGFGKGYALEKISNLLKDASVESAFISFGESSVLAAGNHPAGNSWKIGMNDYLNPGKSIHEFRVSGGSVSTSSNFFVTDNGTLKNHRHVIDPESGKPIEQLRSVSVCSESPVLAEMLSTAFLILPDKKIEKVKEQYDNLEVISVDYESGEATVKTFDEHQTA